MKSKALAIMFSGLFVCGLILVGCGDKGSEDNKPEGENKKTPEHPEHPKKTPDKTPDKKPDKTPDIKVPDVKVPDKVPVKVPDVKVPDVKVPTKAPEKAPAKTGALKPTPWAKAKVGDMCKYKGMNNMTQTWKVVKTDDKNAHVEIAMEMAGQKLPAQTQQMPKFSETGMPPQREGTEVKELAPETLTVGGKTFKCKVMQTMMKAGGKTITSKTWVCEDAPCGGMIKMTSDAMGTMKVMMEMIECKKGS